jgi:hypothetical protein
MPVSNRGKDGVALRSVLRFDHAEFDAAGQGGTATPVVFEQFFLDPARPVVRHRVSALAISRTEDGPVGITAMPARRRKRREAANTDRLVDRLAADIPPMTAQLTIVATHLSAMSWCRIDVVITSTS